MYMNLKSNQHKRISFNTTTMTSLGLTGPLALRLGGGGGGEAVTMTS